MLRFIAFTCLLLLSLYSCSKENDPNNQGSENEDYYDCTGFFVSGDYSSFCTISTPIINVSDSVIDGGGTICKYIIPALDPNIEEETGVFFTSLQTSAQAQQFFENRRLYSDTSSLSDTLKFHNDIVVNGHDAYISEGRYANYSKTITTTYKNVLVTVAVVYYKGWFPVTPCNYETDELKVLLSDVLKNM